MSRTGEYVRLPAAPAPAVVDTTGAGDAFTGYFATAQAAGVPFAAALAVAAEAAAVAVSRPGAMDSIPSGADVAAWRRDVAPRLAATMP